jgi:hypothetical protein
VPDISLRHAGNAMKSLTLSAHPVFNRWIRYYIELFSVNNILNAGEEERWREFLEIYIFRPQENFWTI